MPGAKKPGGGMPGGGMPRANKPGGGPAPIPPGAKPIAPKKGAKKKACPCCSGKKAFNPGQGKPGQPGGKQPGKPGGKRPGKPGGKQAGKGQGGGGKGQGKGGGKAPDADSSDESYRVRRLRGRMRKGPIAGAFLIKGKQIKGEARAALKEVVQAAKAQETRAVERASIPKGYRVYVRDYFDSITPKR